MHIKDKYREESINQRRVEVNVYGESRRAANLKFKFVNAQKWTEAFRRTMGMRVQAIVLAAVCLAMLTTCGAAPARPTQSVHLEKSAKSYLEKFGYLNKRRLEVENLKQWDANKFYEDDFKIGIKTLQEFAGIPVTGELDEATLKLMKRRRCGRPDIEPSHTITKRKKRFAIQGEKWKHTNLTWSLSSSALPSHLKQHETRAILARALDVWEQESRLTFTEVNSNEVDILVSFVRGYHDDAYPFDGRGNILAHAFFPGTGRGGDAHFDDDELWLLQSQNDEEDGTSLLAVAAHEFGHSLGLSHSSVVGALMYPYYQGIQPNFVLPEDDRNGIQQLYGPKEKRTWGRIPPPYRPVETPPPTTTTTTTTTTTRRPHIPPYRPRQPNYYPTYYPNNRHPERPTYYPYHPERRHYNTSVDNPRRPSHRHRTTETTAHPPTHRPKYPYNNKPEYPTHPRFNNNYPTERQKPYHPVKTTIRPTVRSKKPDTCDTSYDAVALIRGELFIFKDRYHWRISDHVRYDNYPMEITNMWPDLPYDLTHVDAVYERPDKKIAFFIGKKLYLFDSRTLVRGYPRVLSTLDLPESLEKLDAAMVWGHNGKTYFYSGKSYWKFDEDKGRVEPDYPRDMSMWKGVGYNIDSVFQWKDGKTYFFKGKGFWKFNDLLMRVEHEKQNPSASFWLNCPEERTGTRSRYRSPPAPGSTLRSPSGASTTRAMNLLPYLSSLFFILAGYLQSCYGH